MAEWDDDRGVTMFGYGMPTGDSGKRGRMGTLSPTDSAFNVDDVMAALQSIFLDEPENVEMHRSDGWSALKHYCRHTLRLQDVEMAEIEKRFAEL